MEFEKGRAKPEEENIPDTVESRLRQLAEMKLELRGRKMAFNESVKHLRESIKCLENIVTAEVMEKGKTVEVGNIRAEYIPVVRIQMRKVENGE